MSVPNIANRPEVIADRIPTTSPTSRTSVKQTVVNLAKRFFRGDSFSERPAATQPETTERQTANTALKTAQRTRLIANTRLRQAREKLATATEAKEAAQAALRNRVADGPPIVILGEALRVAYNAEIAAEAEIPPLEEHLQRADAAVVQAQERVDMTTTPPPPPADGRRGSAAGRGAAHNAEDAKKSEDKAAHAAAAAHAANLRARANARKVLNMTKARLDFAQTEVGTAQRDRDRALQAAVVDPADVALQVTAQQATTKLDLATKKFDQLNIDHEAAQTELSKANKRAENAGAQPTNEQNKRILLETIARAQTELCEAQRNSDTRMQAAAADPANIAPQVEAQAAETNRKNAEKKLARLHTELLAAN